MTNTKKETENREEEEEIKRKGDKTGRQKGRSC